MLDERLAKWVEKALPIAICIHGGFGAASYQVRPPCSVHEPGACLF